MPTQKESHATGVPPLYLTLTEVGDRPSHQKCKTNPICTRPTTQMCETNPIYHTARLRPPRRTPEICKTNPISTRPTTRKRETNPIRVYQVSNHPQKTRNEPNLTPHPPARDPNMQNEPNFHHRRHPDNPKIRKEPNLPLPQLGPRHKCAKRTQSQQTNKPRATVSPYGIST